MSESGPRSIVPVFAQRDPAGTAPAQAAAHVTYHGGRLLGSVQVTTVFWGAAWTAPPQTQISEQVNAFFDAILVSSLVDMLAEYGVSAQPISRGRRVATVTVTDSEPGGGAGAVSDGQVQQALNGWIAAGTVPQPAADSLYFIYLPPGITSTFNGQQSCQVYCGYHSNSGGAVFYAVEPFPDCTGCMFASSTVESLTTISSHELCEAITDPAGDGWYDDSTGNEIGDICVGDVVPLDGYSVQAEWSNSAGSCGVAPSG